MRRRDSASSTSGAPASSLISSSGIRKGSVDGGSPAPKRRRADSFGDDVVDGEMDLDLPAGDEMMNLPHGHSAHHHHHHHHHHADVDVHGLPLDQHGNGQSSSTAQESHVPGLQDHYSILPLIPPKSSAQGGNAASSSSASGSSGAGTSAAVSQLAGAQSSKPRKVTPPIHRGPTDEGAESPDDVPIVVPYELAVRVLKLDEATALAMLEKAAHPSPARLRRKKSMLRTAQYSTSASRRCREEAKTMMQFCDRVFKEDEVIAAYLCSMSSKQRINVGKVSFPMLARVLSLDGRADIPREVLAEIDASGWIEGGVIREFKLPPIATHDWSLKPKDLVDFARAVLDPRFHDPHTNNRRFKFFPHITYRGHESAVRNAVRWGIAKVLGLASTSNVVVPSSASASTSTAAVPTASIDDSVPSISVAATAASVAPPAPAPVPALLPPLPVLPRKDADETTSLALTLTTLQKAQGAGGS